MAWWGLALGLWLGAPSAEAGSAEVGGYFRVAARPDFQGGNGRLGYWNLYGRLMNEGAYGMVDLRYMALEPATKAAPWTSVHARVEGGAIGGADPSNGSFANLRLSQMYVRAGNVLLPGVVWQVGTLDWYMGDLGLYDFRPANIFFESVGLSGRVDTRRVEAVFGVGDAGFFMRPGAYNTILTPGGTLRLRLGKLELGGGGQAYIEPKVVGKRTAPHTTPGVDYEDLVRGEVVENFLEENPGFENDFTDPVAASATSWKAFGYLGFGGFGPVVWNNLYVSAQKVHPGGSVTENVGGRSYTIYTTEYTDERTVLTVGNQLQLRVVPERVDAVWAFYYGNHRDADNLIAPSDHNRWYASTVLRTQAYLTPTVHFLAEGVVAREVSTNGNAFRNHADSIFRNTGGTPDTRGLEYGDANTRDTIQGKTGFVLNPVGPGVFSRPSLRVLYGAQWSSQNNAFGNDFVETVDQQNAFGNVERHVHHLVSLETEVWF